MASKPGGPKSTNGDGLEIDPRTKLLWSGASRTPTHQMGMGKAEVSQEEMGKSTAGAAGTQARAYRERSTEITSGRDLFQQGLAATCKDSLSVFKNGAWGEELGLAHEPVRATKAG